MDKKKYESPRYEMLRFDSRIAAAGSPCGEAVVSVVFDPSRVTECQTSDTTDTMWNDEF